MYLKQLKILFSRKSKKKKPFVFNTTTILFTISIKPLVNQSDPIEIIVTNRINQSILEKNNGNTKRKGTFLNQLPEKFYQNLSLLLFESNNSNNNDIKNLTNKRKILKRK